MIIRPHQVAGTQFLLQHNNKAILADAAGLGKTKIVLDAVFTKEQFPVLVVCTKLGLAVWVNEIHKWYNESSVVITGPPKKREELLQ